MNYPLIPLPEMKPGKEYIIEHIEEVTPGALRLKGYGIFPGTGIKLLFASPSGNPFAYEIMGTVLALRHEDSGNIFVSPSCG